MRRAAKTDANQTEIVKALRDAGCSVLILSSVGGGCPDLLVSSAVYPHSLALLEIKDGKRPPSERKLTKDQEKFHRNWKGPIYVVTSIPEALAAVGIMEL